MSPKRGNPDQYLQKVGGTYYARVRVPRTLEKYIGQTHIRRSLKTGERSAANRLKHAVVGKIKSELARLSASPKKIDDRGVSFEEAKRWRESLLEAEQEDDSDLHGTIQSLVIDKAEQLEQLYGTDKAKRWYKAATATTDTLTELMEKWMDVSDYKASTKSRSSEGVIRSTGIYRE
jgi:hypothetical protein